MHMLLVMRQGLALTGGMTQSIFPRVEALLVGSGSKYSEALCAIASRKDMNRYQSLMDFLICEIYTMYKKHCFFYYDDNGPNLKSMLEENPSQLIQMNDTLLRAIEIALEQHTQFKGNWGAFREEALKMAA